ncbi:MAG TPA: NAD(P)-binding domain-containing protein [Cyclobacteriaceae bacterium]|nr:NAD(P)-binding domain-containing protein [Cyclobacteriaceae bacterium]
MEIGVIGLNEFSKRLCEHWISRGHKILFADLHLYSGGYAFAEKLGPQVSLSLPEKVARQAEIIVLSVSMKHLESVILSLGDIKQKIVVDVVEEKKSDQDLKLSSFQEIKRLLPEAKVVKVTSDYPFHLFKQDSSKQTLYVYSNDQLAQRMVRWCMDGNGYKMIDLNIQTII